MDFTAPSFSLLNSSDSQGSTPSDSLSSFPSEPPEIGKWFLSYVYESPELDIGEDLEYSASVRGNDCEKERNDIVEETLKGKEENKGKIGKGEDLDSKGFVRCKNVIENNNFASQVSGLTDSFLLGSEPPNIKNWFSSYVYESPAIGSSDGIDFSEYKENIFDLDGIVTEKLIRANKGLKESSRVERNDGLADEHMVSGGDKKNRRSLETNGNDYAHKDQNGVDREQTSDALTEVPFKSTAELFLNGKVSEDLGKTSTKVCKELPKVAKRSIHNDKFSPKRSIHQISAHQREDNTVSADDDAMEKASRSINKENDGNISVTSCFISTRKNSSQKENNENLLTNNCRERTGMDQNGARVSHDVNGHKNVTTQRKALLEKTNILRSDANEVTGKWRCPQKSKPNLGPPLKQLRLEQWIRRV